MKPDDAILLARYAREGDEAAFAELVRRQVDFVYATALRQVNGDVHLAQDAVQLVFLDLARKAGSLAEHRWLAGWLFTSTRYAAAKLVRTEQRRRARESEARHMQTSNAPDNGDALDWTRVRPVLNDALDELSRRDREAILLRFLREQNYAAIGAKLALSENAARMCVGRALEKLRARLARRGLKSTAAALAAALAGEALTAAPAGLSASVATAALSGAALAGGSATAIATFMNLTKLQLGLAGAVVLGGGGTFLVQEKINDDLRRELATGAPVASPEELDRLRASNRDLEHRIAAAAAVEVSPSEWARLQAEAAATQDLLERNAREARLKAMTAPLPRAAPSARPALGIRELDQVPKAKRRAAPKYPAVLRHLNVEGNVVVEFEIAPTGKVVEAHVVQSSNSGFEMAALQAVQTWEFEPGLKDGRAVSTKVTQQMQFNMADDNPPPVPTWF